MPFSNNPKGMSQVMTIILTTVIGTMIAAIIGISAGDIIPGAFEDTEHDSCIQQIETTCQTQDLEGDETASAPAACRGIAIDDIPGYDSDNFETDDDEETPQTLTSCD